MRALVVAVALVAVAVAAPAGPARADDSPGEDDKALIRAKKLHKEGEKLFALGKFGPALVKYEAAFEAKQLPAFLFNIGQCHRNLGDYDAAIFSFRKYLKLKPDADNRAAVLEYIDELEREKQRASANDVGLMTPEPGEPGEPVDPPRRGTPIYKKWWFWGGVAVVGAGVVGTAVVLSGGGPPSTDLGNIDFGR